MKQQVLRSTIERLWLKSVRFYTFNTPISKGKYRLYEAALNLCRYPPTQIATEIRDGRRFRLNLTEEMHKSVFFLGEYERAVTDVIAAVVRKDDICLDIGANFGWYTTLLSRLCSDGEIHAFEPMPDIFSELEQTRKLAGEPKNIQLNNLALGDENRLIDLYRFTEMSSGFSSFSAEGKDNFQTFSVPMMTLDSYLTGKKINDVNFVKLDIEGAELMFLRGATKLFEQATPPILMAEMALATTKSFGYLPNDLIEFIRQHADYNFYALNEFDGTLREIDGFAPDEIGANVLGVPKNTDSKRLEKLKIIR